MTTRFTPAQVISYFATKPEDMPKMSTPTAKPNYQTITEFQRKLDENLLAVPSENCNLGHLAIAVKPTDFKTMNGVHAFDIPQDPGTKCKLTPLKKNSTEEQKIILPHVVAEKMRIFNQEKEDYNKYTATINVVRNLIINSVENKYICFLKHERTMYQNVDPIDLLNHLWDTYGTVDDGDIIENEKRMKQQWNPPTTIESLYQQLEVGQKYAKQGGEDISDRQLYRWGYENILNTGRFDRACEK